MNGRLQIRRADYVLDHNFAMADWSREVVPQPGYLRFSGNLCDWEYIPRTSVLQVLCSGAYVGGAMWIVEVNIFGRRFTHQVHDRREALKARSRAVQTRLSHRRNPQAVA